MTQQYVRTISSSSDTSRILSVRGKVLARPSGRSVKPSERKPIKDRIALFLKDIAKIHPDVANFRLDARQTESDFQQFLRSLKTYK
jgi:hypothetical protein